jgi:hypothetical protein
MPRVLADTPASVPHREKPDLSPSRIQIFSPQPRSVGAPSVPPRTRNAYQQANDDSSAAGPTDSDCLVHFCQSKSRECGKSAYLIRDYARFVHFEMDIAIIRSLLFLKLQRRRISGQKTTSRSLPGWLLPSLSRVILICRFEQSKRDGLRGPTATIS